MDVQTNADVKTVHDASRTTIPTAKADRVEMTDLALEAHHAHGALFVQDEMTDLGPGVLNSQDEMTDLDQAEMTDLAPEETPERRTSPILNTSRGRCIALWTACA